MFRLDLRKNDVNLHLVIPGLPRHPVEHTQENTSVSTIARARTIASGQRNELVFTSTQSSAGKGVFHSFAVKMRA